MNISIIINITRNCLDKWISFFAFLMLLTQQFDCSILQQLSFFCFIIQEKQKRTPPDSNGDRKWSTEPIPIQLNFSDLTRTGAFSMIWKNEWKGQSHSKILDVWYFRRSCILKIRFVMMISWVWLEEFVCFVAFNGTSTFLGNLMPNPFL